ncbi:MAG TPA: DUF4019 domain-containing protein [Terriglobales bacterium]|nr:DUF4019 domain-containing protein [Terriglobales bacterium]
MKFIRVFAALVVLPFIATLALADEAAMKQQAQSAGEQWLAVIDNGKYGESYDMAAPMFKAALQKADWERSLRAVRAPLGNIVSRQLASATYTTSLPGAPNGKYVVMQFNTNFQNKKDAVETLTMVLADDGQWKSTGYFIR